VGKWQKKQKSNGEKKMRLLKGFHFLLVAILVMTLLIASAAAELKTTQTDDGKTLISNGTYWITFDPIGDHIVGDQFFINGTTNLSVGTEIYYQFLAPEGGCHTKICTRQRSGIDGIIVLQPDITLGAQTFSISINTTEFQSNWFVFLFTVISSDNPSEVDVFNPFSQVNSVLLFPENWRKIIAQSQLTHPDAGMSYWILINDNDDLTKTCKELTGMTNLPPGEVLSYSFFSPVEYGPYNNVDPIRNIQGMYHGAVVARGENHGINRFILPVNTNNFKEWTNVIIWNPRYNTTDRSDSLSTSREFHPARDAQNISTNCSVTVPLRTPTSSPSMPGTCGTCILVIFVYVFYRKRGRTIKRVKS
jgi:hypothetical protein